MTRPRTAETAARRALAGRLDAAADGLDDPRHLLVQIDLDAVESNAAGLMEHPDVVHLVRRDRVVDTVPNYRGLGLAW